MSGSRRKVECKHSNPACARCLKQRAYQHRSLERLAKGERVRKFRVRATYVADAPW